MKKPVLVVGGGIAGIQASLDLAEMGVPVFIVENSPSIGGRMAQLDKTFPTNDCSACILAPKVTACYNHPLIKTFTLSELLELKGEAPDFTAVIRKKPRYINEELCKGCSDCTLKCPIEKGNEFDMELGKRKAVYKPFAQAVPNKVAIEKKGTSPCKYKCPAHISAHGYVALIGQGRYEEALEVVREVTPLAGVLGRVCFHPCESKCSRQYVDEPISIASLKRFIADYEIQQGKKPEIKPKEENKGVKIAIVGSGPAGLNCAYQLALAGYSVTIFEALPEPGGMLRVGIPSYRLDKSILDREINILKDMGVEIRCNTTIGKDLTFEDLRKDGFKAIFLAIGAHKDVKLGIKGEDSPGVVPGVKFLRELNLGKKPEIGKRVVVIGGGNVAMDVSRSAIRLGCDVTVVYRRSELEMPASTWEIEHAKEEGVKFEFLTSPLEVVLENNKVKGLKCIRNKLGKADASGRRRPVPIEGSEFIVEADTIIPAIGQVVEQELIAGAGEVFFTKQGNIECDPEKMITSKADIFAGGDAVSGPATVIEAIAAGNRAAVSIRNYLEGKNLPVSPLLLPETPLEEIDFNGLKYMQRARMPVLDIEKRINTFEEFELGFDEKLAREEALRCVDCSICSECKACEKACQSNAINHYQAEEIIELPVSAVIMACGFDTSKEIPEIFGYGKYKNVVTSLEYERILSASGPYQGHVQRPSDGKAPSRIAFIQCVGSRDTNCDSEYCSAVCCMYAVKEAIITKEHLPSVKDIDIFYMDMRAYGKDFDKYIDSAKEKYGIKFIKSRVADVTEDASTEMLELKYCDERGNVETAQYDMVVLSVGLIPKADMQPLFEKVGVKTDKYGFCWVNEMSAPQTSKEGVLACGAAAGPKDIPETVVEASAASAEAGKIAFRNDVSSDEYSAYFKQEEETAIRDVSREPIRIGVFICHCGVNIGGYLDVKAVVEYAKTLPFVEYSDQNLYTCSVDAQKVIVEKIKEHNLNRVVVASCTPRTHEPLFQSVVVKAGLNPYLFTMANIRDQCSWVHMDKWHDATEKAKDLVKMAVARAVYAKQLTRQKIQVKKSALIIGGGMAGITAALELAEMGFKAYLVEKSGRLGGNALRLYTAPTGRQYGDYINKYVDQVMNNPLVEVFLNARIKNINGYVGNYSTLIEHGGQDREIEHGVVIVATGASEYKPDGYLYGRHSNVITQMELEERLKEQALDLAKVNNVVMIQCVGSRNDERPYCSRVCCNQAIKNALLLKEIDKSINVTILYRDIRAYGLNEINYHAARKAGVNFIRYEPEKEPVVSLDNGSLIVNVEESLLGEAFNINADLLVLSTAITTNIEENSLTAKMLKVPLNPEGFFLEAHAKLRPVDFATDGVFLCGLAHAPKNLKETITQGKAAAARAANVISKDMLETEGTIAQVNEIYCSGCGSCEKVCAYKAVSVQDISKKEGVVRKAVVNAVLCKGCGTCSAACRCGAIDVNGFADRQILSEMDYLLKL